MGVTIAPPENDIFSCFFFFLFQPPQQNLIIIIQNRMNCSSVRTYCCIVNLAVDSWPRQTTKEMFQSAVFFVCFCCPYEVGTGCFNINIALVFFRDVDRTLLPTAKSCPNSSFPSLKTSDYSLFHKRGRSLLLQTPTGTRFPPSHPHIQPPHTFHFHSYFRKLQYSCLNNYFPISTHRQLPTG